MLERSSFVLRHPVPAKGFACVFRAAVDSDGCLLSGTVLPGNRLALERRIPIDGSYCTWPTEGHGMGGWLSMGKMDGAGTGRLVNHLDSLFQFWTRWYPSPSPRQCSGIPRLSFSEGRDYHQERPMAPYQFGCPQCELELAEERTLSDLCA